jgi:hypothetical protein
VSIALKKVVCTLMIVGVVSQLLALVLLGHTIYLWVQGVEVLAASVALFGFGMHYRRHDARSSRWPPLLPLAAIGVTGAVKDFYVATSRETPTWLVVLLLASVIWLLGSSWVIWKTAGRARNLP